jgi:hypothetical protein
VSVRRVDFSVFVICLSSHRYSYIGLVFSSRSFIHNKQQVPSFSNYFHCDLFGDHFQTCQVKSPDSQVHDWVVYWLGDILGSVGHRVKIHKITSPTGKEREDLEIKDYVVLQKPQEQTDRLPPSLTLIYRPIVFLVLP